MQLNIKATNFKLTPAIEDWILNKIKILEKYIPNLDKKGVVDCWVEVGKTTMHHQKGDIFRAEANISLPGKVLRAEASEDDLKMAIVRVKDELQRQLGKYKDGFRAKERRGARIVKKMKSIDPLAIDPNEIDTSIRHRDE